MSPLLFVFVALLLLAESKWQKEESADDNDDDYDDDDDYIFDIADLEDLRKIVIQAIVYEKVGLVRGHKLVHPLDLLEKGDFPLLASMVRLSFHDCAGFDPDTQDIPFCDGCIALDDKDNAGLEPGAVIPLEDICVPFLVNKGLSIADCWALSATFALEFAAENAIDALAPSLVNDLEIKRGDIPYYIGRKDCKTSPNNPKYALFDFPDPDLGWDHIESFFKRRYPSYTNKDIVAIVGGGHSLGRGHLLISGYSSEWDASPEGLDNHYFKTLTDIDDQFAIDSGIINDWFGGEKMLPNAKCAKEQFMLNLQNWRDIPGTLQENNFLMLNADISLAWNLSYYIRNGLEHEIDCSTMAYRTCGNQTVLFPGDEVDYDSDSYDYYDVCDRRQCPVQCKGDVQELFDIEHKGVQKRLDSDSKCTAAFSREFARDNHYFVSTFVDAFVRMFTSGYRNEKDGTVGLREIEYDGSYDNGNGYNNYQSSDVVSGLQLGGGRHGEDSVADPNYDGLDYKFGSVVLVAFIILLNIGFIGYRFSRIQQEQRRMLAKSIAF